MIRRAPVAARILVSLGTEGRIEPMRVARLVFKAAIVVAAAAATAHIGAERAHKSASIERCKENVRVLLSRYYAMPRKLNDSDWPWPGSVNLLTARIQHLYPEDFWTRLRCPADPGSEIEPDVEALVKSRGASSGWTPRAMRQLAAYAVRNYRKDNAAFNPASVGTRPDEVWVICDRCGDDGRTLHHPGGLVVGFADGSVRFVTRAELGLQDGEPIVLGPESDHPQLQAMATFWKRGD